MDEPQQSNPPTRNSPFCLLVEGASDRHAIIHLMKRHRYNWDSREYERPFVLSYDGIANLPKAIAAQKTKRRLGIVIDADEQPEKRWREVKRWVQAIVTELPEVPKADGLILDGVEPGCQVGIWLMPDNRCEGALEDFVKQLVPDADPCWGFAGEQAQVARQRYQRADSPFRYNLKSQLHTWLAWQKEPGISFGQALNLNVLGHDSQTAQLFRDWFLRLFPKQ